jgi:signal transduction histidine kinase
VGGPGLLADLRALCDPSQASPRRRFAWLADTEVMLRAVNWAARSLGFAWLCVLAFVVAPPHGTLNASVQIAGYCVAGAALLAWTVLDLYPAAARYRDRWLPVTLGVMAVGAGIAAAAGGGGYAMVIFAFVAAMVAGGDTSLTAALAVTASGILAIEVSGLVLGDSYGGLLGLPAIVLAGLVIGRNRGAYRVQAEQAAALLAQRERLQAELRRADLLEERARIAREIHDVLAHSLGALGIQIQAARAVLTDHHDVDKAGEILTAAQKMAAQGLVETRRAVHALRSDTLPLDEELALVAATYTQRYHVPVSFDTGGVPGPLPPDATIALLRIAQEALVNAAKHATGQPVAVRLDYGDADVRLTIRNDLDPDAPGAGNPALVSTVDGGYGLTGMRERLRLLNGTLEAGRRGDQWVVTAELPRSQPETIGS